MPQSKIASSNISSIGTQIGNMKYDTEKQYDSVTKSNGGAGIIISKALPEDTEAELLLNVGGQTWYEAYKTEALMEDLL